MATLQKLFVSEGLPERPYQSLDSQVTYKSETATAEMKEVKPLKSEFHPITTEIHVTELRPIKLDPVVRRGASESTYPPGSSQTWQKRLQSESALGERTNQKMDHSYNSEYRQESRQTHHSSSTTHKTDTMLSHSSDPGATSNMIRTVTSRTGTGSYSGSSPGSSPSATMSPPVRRRDKVTAEFKRRDVSPEFKYPEQKVQMIDGKCNCCPYGYHVDVDFMGYVDTINSQSYLKQLKRIQREKRRLRKSMENYLQGQDRTEIVTSELANRVENHSPYQGSTTNRILNEIDTSVDATLTSIETMMKNSKQSRTHSEYDNSTSVSNSKPKKFNTFPKKVGRQVAQELQSYNETFTATLNTNDRVDSANSLSSISTDASEYYLSPQPQAYTTRETTTSRTTNMTSQQLAETMATHLPVEDGAAASHSNTTNISKDSLHAIREAMAVSLQRMKELEEQVKAIPVLQVRISVLKEEKRLLGLQQLQAQQKPSVRSIGVGDDSVLEIPKEPLSPRSPPPTAPKPKKVKMAATGDHSVLGPYLLQPDLPSAFTSHDNTHVYERDTIVIDRAQKLTASLQQSSRPLTRSVGVGEGNVFDDSLHIHEKELRTVIIGQGTSAGKRNVGIECRVPTRDVGVSFTSVDAVEKPATRTVGITTETSALVTNVSFKSEEFTSALKNALHRSVRSMAVQVDSRPEKAHVGIQYSTSSWDVRSIAVGDDSIDVEVRKPVARRSVSVDAFPDRMNRSVNTDFGWRLDASTNTVAQFTEAESTQTDTVRSYSSATMTDRDIRYNVMCQTDVLVFAATDQLRNMGTNTEKLLTYSTGVNTILKPNCDRGVNTIQEKYTRNSSVNTDAPRIRDMGVGDDKIDSFVCNLNDDKNSEEEYRMDEESVETKTTYYTSEAGKADTKTDKGYEIKREYGDSYEVQSSQKDRKGSTTSSSSEDDRNEEIVEEKVWRTTGDGQFTVTTVTTKKVYGADGDASNVVTETKTVTGGPEVLGSDANMIQKEVEKGRMSNVFHVEDADSAATTSTTYTTAGRTGSTAIERVLGADTLRELEDGVTYTTRVSEISSSGDGNFRSGSSILGAELDDLRGISSDSGMSSSQMSSSSEQSYRVRSGSPQRPYPEQSTSFRVRETSPQRFVSEKRTVISVRDGSPQREQSYTRSYDSGIGSPQFSRDDSESSEVVSRTVTYTDSSSGSGFSSSQFDERLSDSGSPSGTLKSIMKKSTSDPGTQLKKGITFAETVVGGDTDSSSSENSDQEEQEEEAEEEAEDEGVQGTTESDSDSSYEEGCYDSREGSIVYKCKDDEAIAKGLPGAKMFDQNIRETYELSAEMKDACRILSNYLEDSTTIQTKQLNASLNVIQQEWFKVTSLKLSEAHQVEDYLSCFNELSRRLLEYIVNLQDANGNTAIHYAVSNCNFEIVSLLLDTGVCDLNKQNKAGYTAIIMATLASIVTQKEEEVVQRLFSMGDVNIKAAKDGQTALMFAVRQKRTELVKMLLDTGADTNIQDDEGSTALMCAGEHGHTEICKLLLNTPGCDANITDNDGSTALSIAMEAGHKDAGVLLYAHVNFGPGQSPAPNRKPRKSGTSPLPSPTPR